MLDAVFWCILRVRNCMLTVIFTRRVRRPPFADWSACNTPVLGPESIHVSETVGLLPLRPSGSLAVFARSLGPDPLAWCVQASVSGTMPSRATSPIGRARARPHSPFVPLSPCPPPAPRSLPHFHPTSVSSLASGSRLSPGLSYLGGGVLMHGCAQEEIMFGRPEQRSFPSPTHPPPIPPPAPPRSVSLEWLA